MKNQTTRIACASAVAFAALAPAAQTAQFIETGGMVAIEAEHYTAKADGVNHAYVIVPDQAALSIGGAPGTFLNARGNRIIQNQPDQGENKNTAGAQDTTPYVEYAVKISTTGDYQLYLRNMGWDGSSDSLYAQIRELKKPAGPGPDWYRYNPTPAANPIDYATLNNGAGWLGDAAPEAVSGSGGEGPAVWSITNAGTYTIRISQREDGNTMDALILQLSSLAAPTDPGPAESALEGILFDVHPKSQVVMPNATAVLTTRVLGTGTITYQWQKAPPGSSTFTDISGATTDTYTTPPMTLADSGTKFRVKATSGATTITSNEATIGVDAGPPTIVSTLGGPDLNRVTVVFSEPLDAASASTKGNYTISGGVTVSSAVLAQNNTTVTLLTSAQTAGTAYTLTVNGVKDLVGNAMVNVTAGFQGASLHKGGLRVDIYQNLAGTSLAILDDPTIATNYPNNPDITTYWNVFGPYAAGNVYGDNYAARVTGWIIPPVDGMYKFYLRSDDAGQLYLSTDATSASEALIAEQTGCCNAFTDAEGTLSSFPVQLQAGQRYWVRGMLKEGGGDDYLQVAWRTPLDPNLNDPAGLTPIPGQYLQTIVDPTGTMVVTQPPTNTSVGASSPASFYVAYTATSAFGGTASVQWQRAAPGTSTFADIPGATGTTYSITFAEPADSGAQFRAVLSIGDLISVTSSPATLTVGGDTTPPTVKSVIGDTTSVTVAFSEPLDAASAANKANYTLDNGATVTGATLVSPAGQAGVVVLATSLTAGQQYTLTINGVKDLSDNLIAANTKVSFTAFHINANFENGTPPTATLYQNAVILPTGGIDNSGVLRLTPSTGSQQGSIVFADPLNGGSAQRFTATFKLWIGNGSGNPADGFSFNVANDLPTASFGEEGAGTGLTIAFDTYDNGGGEAPAISIKWGGVEFATTNLSKATLVNNQWVTVVIKVDADGTLDVTHNNIKYFDNLPIAGWAPIAGPQVGLGARTGGEYETHYVDDFAMLFNADVALPQPPSIVITSPANNSTFSIGANVPITVNAADPEGQVAKVEFFVNDNKVGESVTAPYGFTLNNVQLGGYTVTAKVTDAQDLTVMSAPVHFVVGTPKRVLFVTTDPGPLTFAGDQAVYQYLLQRLHDVYLMRGSDIAADGSNATGYDVIIISSSLSSSSVADKLQGAATPVIYWESALQDNFMAQADPDPKGTTDAQNQINIVDANTPLSAGFPVGLLTVTTAPATFSWGTPVGAHVVATIAANTAQAVIHYYDKGEAGYTGFVMPERRVFFYFQDNTASVANADGMKLFGAALDWTMRIQVVSQPVISYTRTGNQLNITWTNGGTLEEAPSLTGTWTAVSTTGSHTVTADQAMRFYRVKR